MATGMIINAHKSTISFIEMEVEAVYFYPVDDPTVLLNQVVSWDGPTMELAW